MTNRQAELFQKVLDEVRGQLHDLLEGFIEHDYFESAQEMLDGIKHVGAIQANIDGAIKREDMKWVVDYIFRDFKEGIEFINAINDDFEILDEDGVKQMVIELQLYFKQS